MNNSTVVGGSPADLLIIGARPGGYRAAEYAAKQGLKAIIFEADNVGGTCLNVGCIPTKTYVHSATFAEARERMAQVVPQLRAGVETILSHPNITLVRGRAQLVDANTVSVGSDSVAAKNIIIATGSETKWLPIKGIDDPRVVDSTGLLNLDTLPKRLAIIGAGVIGMEFASVFNRFGS
jgi:dihydrolipoamide dehydrogenase